MPDREKVIKEYEDYVNSYISLTTSHDYEFEMHKAVLALLKEQEHKDRMYHALEDDWKRLKELLKEQEAVVRCKDCKKRDSWECWQYFFGRIKIPDDWFCAEGERKPDY